MSKALYVGIEGIARKVKKMYIGGVKSGSNKVVGYTLE